MNPRCYRGKPEDAAYAVNGTPRRDRFCDQQAMDTRLSVANVVRVSDRQSAFTVDVVS
jgi:hypothetical protein